MYGSIVLFHFFMVKPSPVYLRKLFLKLSDSFVT